MSFADRLNTLDRRWIFLAMGLAVAIPVLFGLQFPESSSALSEQCFQMIEELEPGDPVLIALDFDPPSKGELEPMATAFVRHCCEKKLKIYFMTLWPAGPQMIDDVIDRVIRPRLPLDDLRRRLREPRLQAGLRRRHQGRHLEPQDPLFD